MEEQDSILLQKKMILMLSAIIFALLLSLMYLKTENVKVATISSIEELNTKLATAKRMSEEEFEKIKPEENIEVIEQVAYSAPESIVINDAKTETHAVETNYVSYRALAESNPPDEYTNVIEATATAYCLCKKCCGKDPSNQWYGYTASGIKIVPGTGMKVIAVDPKVIPLGTKVYVQGLNGAWDYGTAIAADTGSAIKNIKIDLYMDSHQETLQWGVKKVNVYIMN